MNFFVRTVTQTRFYATREFAFRYKSSRALAMRQHCATTCASVGRARLEYTLKIFFTQLLGVANTCVRRELHDTWNAKRRKGSRRNALLHKKNIDSLSVITQIHKHYCVFFLFFSLIYSQIYLKRSSFLVRVGTKRF